MLAAARPFFIATIAWAACLAACGAAPEATTPDRDGDGVLDADDLCPDEVEDADGFYDADGCPDRDNDGDGRLDVDDRCPDEPETVNRWRDDDGCPDVVPETDADADGDGIADPVDGCPDAPEDIDRFEDDDGCPDPDNDRDGILDAQDACPWKPETYNGVDDADGCPENRRPRCRAMGNEHIEIHRQIRFESGEATVPSAADDLLASLSEIMTANRDTLIVIVGHADDRGTRGARRRVSMRRARAVHDALVARGVRPAQLALEGVGATDPKVPERTPEGRAENRRVEFIVARSPCLRLNPRYRSFFPDVDPTAGEGLW